MTEYISAGVERIAAERQRQITEEGHRPELDRLGGAVQLEAAGTSYAEFAYVTMLHNMTIEEALAGNRRSGPPPSWPWNVRYWKPTGDPVRDVIKAGALLAAALDVMIAEREDAS